MTEIIQQGEASTIVVYPPDNLRGLVTSDHHRIMTPAVELDGTWVQGVAPAFSTTTTAGAARGATTLALASISYVGAGYKILIGVSLVAEIESISGLVVTLASPLPEAIASGAAVKGLELLVPISEAQSAEAGNAWIEMRANEKEIWVVPFVIASRVVAYQLDTEELFSLVPRVRTMLPSDDADGAKAIKAAWRTQVERHLAREGLKAEQIRSWDAVSDWHATAVAYHLVLNSPRSSVEEIDTWSQAMATKRNSALEDRRFWYSETEAIGEQPDNPIPRTRFSWTR